MTESSSNWREQPITIAVKDREDAEWDYQTFPNWYQAREAVNAARRTGKLAIVYESRLSDVPESIYPNIPDSSEQE